ncbi:ABC transporter substrate-binding protein [Gordonia jinhuaensis]|uniref:Amino acid ABC transporter, substrate binding protein n=1 Tax=Gordonia jinhuaensis TaxID=1517702 RepID=A0A916TD61_9ACTN|nr:ABC transporter substrate-binding protein [Gordonia jinhuaensis]GGB38871.1 putative amino acid ABC transporter, substrate binding protein [Gordonia jinhuaensis]
MTTIKSVLAAAGLATAVTVALAACSSSSSPLSSDSAGESSPSGTITVGSANFAENEILAYVYADALKDNGLAVNVKPNIGARDVYISALKDGSIDLIPEYSGNLLQYFDSKATAQSADEVYTALKAAVPSGFEVLDKAQAQDADSYNVTSDFSKKNNVTSLDQLAGLNMSLKVAGPPEFQTRPYGIPGLKSVYGVSATLVPINDGGGPSTVKALKDGTVQLADIFSTTPAIKQNGFVTLADPKHMILAQNVVPLINTAKANGKAAEVINKVQANLTTDDLIAMNTKSSVDKDSAEQVAKEWLADKKLFG